MIHVFIVNPTVCERGLPQKLRDTLAEFDNLDHYVFTTRHPGHEKELVELLCHFFDKEEIRFYCCGGSGTMRNMLAGFTDLSHAEVAFVPYGSSDFLKVFTDDQGFFRNIRSMVYGEVIYVDYIKTNLGVALNSVSFGVDTETLRVGKKLRDLGFGIRTFPYEMASVYAALMAPNRSYDFSIDDETYNNTKTTMLFMGNGDMLGGRYNFGINSYVDDGLASFLLIENKSPAQRINILSYAKKRKLGLLEKQIKLCSATRMKCRRSNGALFYVNLDGELCSTYELTAEVVHQGLKFVLPRRGV
jgi:diacylglycerol kinase family enzyme